MTLSERKLSFSSHKGGISRNNGLSGQLQINSVYTNNETYNMSLASLLKAKK